MSRKRSRRVNFTASQKVSIVREHLLERVPISALCDRHGLKPNQFYLWQKQFFEQGTKAFESPRDSKERQLECKLAKLQNVAREKDEVIAELAAEMVRLKKRSWGSLTVGWVPPDIRDEVVDFVTYWSERTRLSHKCFAAWIRVQPSKYADWKRRYGKANEHRRVSLFL